MSIAATLAAVVTRPFTRKRIDPAAAIRDQHAAHARLMAARSILSEITDDLVNAETEQQVLAVFRRRAEARAAAVAAQRDLDVARAQYDQVCQRCDIGGPSSLPGRY